MSRSLVIGLFVGAPIGYGVAGLITGRPRRAVSLGIALVGIAALVAIAIAAR